MIRDLRQRPFLHERSPDAPEVIVSTPLRPAFWAERDCDHPNDGDLWVLKVVGHEHRLAFPAA